MAAVMPPGQQGKDQCFPGLRRQSDLITTPDGNAPASVLEFPHQNRVTASASGHQQLNGLDAASCLQLSQILSHHRRGEAGEGRHRIDGRDRPQLPQASLEILPAKAFTPR